MRHAYLILAHNEFEVVQRLISAIDDIRNDIFIHWDAKVKIIPTISVSYSNLYILSNRINVCWGDISVVEAEFELFKTAIQTSDYEYFHLLSGVDMPLKSQDYIHRFFEMNNGKEFIGYSTYDTSAELDRKVKMWHLFSKRFKSNNSIIRILRAVFLRVQYLIGYKRNNNIEFKKGTQWLSITNSLAKYFIKNWGEIKHIYSHTFCSDEIVLQTLCWNSLFRNNIYDLSNEGKGCLRAIKWNKNIIEDWNKDEIMELVESELLFARKFSSKQLDIIDLIVKLLKNDE